MTEESMATTTTEVGQVSRHRGILVAEAATALVLALVVGVWAYTDPYTSLDTRAVLLRVVVGVVVSVGLSAVLLSRGGRVPRNLGRAVIALRAPVLVVYLLGFLLPKITSALL